MFILLIGIIVCSLSEPLSVELHILSVYLYSLGLKLVENLPFQRNGDKNFFSPKNLVIE